MSSDDNKPTIGLITFGPGMGEPKPTATNAPISVDASKYFCEHQRLLTRDCEQCDAKRDDELRAEGRRYGIEEAAKLMEENAACFEKSGQRDIAWQLHAEARHIRDLLK